MRFTLRQLEVFLAVARSESVSRAAEELGMSASAVSGALSDLESQFEVQLFDRIGKRLQLSRLGRSLRPRCNVQRHRTHAQQSSFVVTLRKLSGPIALDCPDSLTPAEEMLFFGSPLSHLLAHERVCKGSVDPG